MTRLTPTEHQEQAIQAIVNEQSRAALNGSDLGTGKTCVAVESINRLGGSTNLVSGPLHTLDGWTKAFDNQTGRELRFVNKKNKAGKAALADLMAGVWGDYFIGRELARTIDWSETPLDVYVADEAHSFSSNSSQGFKAHKKIDAQFKIAQSATWFGSSFENAWAVPKFLWPEHVENSYWFWREKWCEQVYDQWAPRHKKVVGERNPGAWANSLPRYVRIESDLPDIEPIEIRYELSSGQRKMYRQMEQQGLAWLQDNPLAAELPITQRIRLREIALAEPSLTAEGEVYFAPDARSSLYDVMTDLLGDLIGEQILMGTHSAKFSRYVGSRLRGSFAWTGEESDENKAQAKADFIAGRTPYIVATQKGIGEGVDGLQDASRVLFELSQDDSPLMNQQFRGRLNRRGQKHRVISYRFVAIDTLDDDQHESLLTKELKMRQSSALARG